ncbi:C-type lectin-like isoform X2 [Labrus mixtus]|uniref:C-type lectin-like isoform X2 n=1 Tax=Labrus mixtus TaxID=508554 RepID=UPI0029C08C21|nr:C-type lectin-like isoform X2 [Labrus mixtus]
MYGDGLWHDEPCGRLYKPVCSDVTGSNVTFVLINTSMSWTDAKSYCREHHTDLASVRNLDENQKIKELISGLTVWIGLSRETWKWTDGSNSSFRYWNLSEPNNNYETEGCVAAYFKDSGRWEDWPCHYKRASICYRADPAATTASSEHDTIIKDQTEAEGPGAERRRQTELEEAGGREGVPQRGGEEEDEKEEDDYKTKR